MQATPQAATDLENPARKHAAIGAQEFQARRRRLIDSLDANSIALLPAAPTARRNADVDYPYRQNSDFLYLSGFHEPEAVLALLADNKDGETILFCRDRDISVERWAGRRMGVDEAGLTLGIDRAFPIDKIDEILPEILQNQHRLYYDLGANKAFDQRLFGWIDGLKSARATPTKPPEQIIGLSRLLHGLRLYKSHTEINIMAQAGEISACAHKRAMQACRAGMLEAGLEAELLYEFAKQGARWPAYPSIVGSGDNACILHYVDNDRQLRDGDLVLIDAGCELAGYASDLTRTFPVNGRFSAAQSELYEIVLAAQQAAINCAQAGLPYAGMQQASDKILTEGLRDLGLLSGELDELTETGAAQPFAMHRVGHWLGLDVHDVGDYLVEGESRLLEAGMVTTVEPGLYIPAGCKAAPARLRGLGIRIEDSVAITTSEPRILTGSVPKKIDDIERLMSR